MSCCTCIIVVSIISCGKFVHTSWLLHIIILAKHSLHVTIRLSAADAISEELASSSSVDLVIYADTFLAFFSKIIFAQCCSWLFETDCRDRDNYYHYSKLVHLLHHAFVSISAFLQRQFTEWKRSLASPSTYQKSPDFLEF